MKLGKPTVYDEKTEEEKAADDAARQAEMHSRSEKQKKKQKKEKQKKGASGNPQYYYRYDSEGNVVSKKPMAEHVADKAAKQAEADKRKRAYGGTVKKANPGLGSSVQ